MLLTVLILNLDLLVTFKKEFLSLIEESDLVERKEKWYNFVLKIKVLPEFKKLLIPIF